MSVESEILRIQQNIADTYATVAAKGGTVPQQPTSSNLAAAVASIPAPSNPNLLDNWYFADPFNQRGQTEYTGEIYGIDRWVGQWTGDGILTVIDPGTKDGCISLYRPAYFAQLCQFVENARGFAGKTLTFSALTKMEPGGRSTIIIYVKSLGNDDLVPISSSVLDGFTEYGLISCSAVIPEDAVEMMVNITSSNAKKSFFKAVKLELGSQQTLAYQDADGNWVLNDPPPDKTLELLKCQRYYQRITANLCTGTVFEIDGKKIAYCPFRYPQMRTVPSITLNGTAGVRAGGSVTSGISTIENTDNPQPNSVMLWFAVSDDAEVGAAASVYLENNSYIELAADL